MTAVDRMPAGLAPWFAFAGRALLSPDAAALRKDLGTLSAGCGDEELWRALESALVQPGGLEADYVRLFLNPSGAPCPPWQSAQGEAPALFGDPHLSALGWYRRANVEPQLLNEPADHGGLLLLFFSELLAEEDDSAAVFFSEHVAWMEAFCETVEAHAQHPFYGRLAAGTRQAIGRCRNMV